MSGSSASTAPTIAIGITGDDSGFNKTIARVTKQMQDLGGAASKLGASTTRLGQTENMSRLTESMHRFGNETFDAFRAMERLVPALGTLVGAGSLAGMVQLTKTFGQAGTAIKNTSYALSMPVDQLTSMEYAARKANVSTEDLRGGLNHLQDLLQGAAFGTNPDAIQFFGDRDIDIKPGVPGHVKKAADAYLELADSISRMKDPAEQLHALDKAGLPQTLLPMLTGGSKAIRDAMKEGHDLGAFWTPKMADDAEAFRQSWVKLDSAIGGVANRIAQDLGNAAKGWLEWGAQIIGENQNVTKSWAEMALGGSFLAGLWSVEKGARGLWKWGKNLLGKGALAAGEEAALTAEATSTIIGAVLTKILPLLQIVETSGDSNLPQPPTEGLLNKWWRENYQSGPGIGPRLRQEVDPQGPGTTRGQKNYNPLNLSFVPNQPGVLGRESGANHQFGVYPDMATGIAAGLRQLAINQDSGLTSVRAMVRKSDPDRLGTPEQEAYIARIAKAVGVAPEAPFNIRDRDTAIKYIRQNAIEESGRVSEADLAKGVDLGLSYRDVRGAAPVSPNGAPGPPGAQGHIHVTVSVTAPPNTNVGVKTDGNVTATPKVQTSMPNPSFVLTP